MKRWFAVAVLMAVLTTMPAWADPVTATLPGAADTISTEAVTVTFEREEAVTVAGGSEAWYKLYVEGSGMLKLTLTGEQASQVQMDVYNEQAALLGRAAAADGALAVEVDASRDYWFYIRLKGQEVDGTATLKLQSGLAAPAPEFSVPADAAPLAFNEATNGHVVAGADRWYALTVPEDAAGDFIVVDMEGKTAEIDIDLTMTDAEGRVLNSSESSRPHERVFAQIPANRKIGLRVFIYRQENASTLAAENDFTLRAYTAAEQPSGTFAPNLPQEFTAVEPGQEVTGSLRDGSAWYRYHIEARGNLRVAFTGEGLEVALLVEDGSQVFAGTAAGTELRFTGDANKFTDFYVKVSGSGQFAFTGTLETGEFVAVPTTYTSLRAGQDMFGALREEVWFKFTATQAGYALLALDARPGDTSSDIDLMVINSEGKVVGKAESTNPREALLLDVEQGETYFVRVYPYRALEKTAEFVLWLQTLDRKL